MKRFVYTVILVLLVAALLPVQQPASAQPPSQEIDRDALYVPGEVVVTFREGMAVRDVRAKAAALASRSGATVAEQFNNYALLSFDPQADVLALSDQMAAATNVVRAQPNYVYWIPESVSPEVEPTPVDNYTMSSDNRSVSLTWEQVAKLRSKHRVGTSLLSMPTFPTEFTTGPLYGAFWGWNKVQADLVWSNSKASGYVCLLDTGVDMTHPDLSGMIVNGPDMVNNDTKSYDDNGHGTHVAGIISAKLNAGSGTAMGVSKTKIYAVKVLNAQGFGTTYNIAAGINTCIKNLSAKIINMSFGMTGDDLLIYNMVKTAVVTKGRLIVAAAGNETTSDKIYPAGWANDTAVGAGVIAVAAGRAPSDDKIWVDRDHDGIVDWTSVPGEKEVFESTECATGYASKTGDAMGTNYGSWVSLVAPGENIYSTTPVSYPFYMNYYQGVPSGYAFLSGTSMAAAYVSGAAARVITTMTSTELAKPINIKNRLVDNGDPLQYAVDTSTLVNPTVGYNNKDRTIGSGESIAYGEAFAPDPDAPNEKVVMAPYCWPDGTAPFDAAQDMSDTHYLNVAAAMDRGALVAEIKDAFSGSPTTGATVTALVGSTIYDTSITTGSPFAVLINLPQGNSSKYQLKVSKSGATTGAQAFNSNLLIQPGATYFDDYSTVSLPSTANMHVVLDWRNPVIGAEGDAKVEVDLDLYMQAPANSNCVHCIIGTESGWDGDRAKYELDDYIKNSFFGAGTLLAPTMFGGSWSPYAIYNFDGVSTTTLQEPLAGSPTESITINRARTLTVRPYYLPKYTGTYQFFVTDNSPSYPWYSETEKQGYLTSDTTSDFFVAPVVRYWTKGYILQTTKLAYNTNNSRNLSCDGTMQWWKPITLDGRRGYPAEVNTCTDDLSAP